MPLTFTETPCASGKKRAHALQPTACRANTSWHNPCARATPQTHADTRHGRARTSWDPKEEAVSTFLKPPIVRRRRGATNRCCGEEEGAQEKERTLSVTLSHCHTALHRARMSPVLQPDVFGCQITSLALILICLSSSPLLSPLLGLSRFVRAGRNSDILNGPRWMG